MKHSRKTIAGALAGTVALVTAACTNDGANAQAGGSSEQPVALGLTLHQLSDADLIDANGMELGEVERVVIDQHDKVTGLIVEIEDSAPDRFVQIPLKNLSSMRAGDDWVLQGDLTREDLDALPDVQL